MPSKSVLASGIYTFSFVDDVDGFRLFSGESP